jgi:hypothetical protein
MNEFPAVIMTELGTVVMPEYDKVITFRDEHANLPQVEKYKVMAH